MKKALSLILTLAMLASLCTVPAWANEDEEFVDIPVIEEVTEKDLEEEFVEIFGEVTEGATEGATDLENVTWHTYVPAAGDGVTYFTEMEGSSISAYQVGNASSNVEGNINSLTNGIYTEGVEIENPSSNADVNHYPTVNGALEGLMGYARKKALAIDFGAEKTFAGIRLVDNHRARAMKARKATKIYVEISSDGTNWTTVDTSDVAVARGQDYETTYGDFYFNRLDRRVNLTARFMRVYITHVNAHETYELEEVIMLDADSSKDTYTPATAKDYYDFDANWTIKEGSTFGGSTAAKLVDGKIFGVQSNCWHSIANAEGHTYTEDDKTVTITFDEPTEVGGIRIFPRTDQLGASPNVVKILATLDGDIWHTIWASRTVGFSTTAMEGKEVYFPFGREYPLMGLKVVSIAGIDANMKQYTCYTELQILKPALPTAMDPDFHVLPDDEVTMGLPIGTFATYGVNANGETLYRGTDQGYKALEGIALTSAYFKNNGSPGGGFGTYQLHHDYGVAGEGVTLTGDWKYNSVRAIYDMGREYEFSGIRLYQRVAGNQNVTACDISISDDGTNWVKLDRVTGSNTVVMAFPTIKFNGETLNYKARYLKLDVVKTASGHWGLEEVRLIKPASGVDTKTATILATEIEALKGNVQAVLDAYEPYTVTLEDTTAINAAKTIFDKLPSGVQATLDGDKLNKLYDAAEQLSHNVRVNKYGTTDPSATNHNGQKGFRNVSYTLYVNDGEAKAVSVTGLSYLGTAISNNYDRWTAVNNGDGTITLTLGGNYWNDPSWKGWIEGPMTASITSFNDTGYYYKTVNKIDNFSTAPIEIRPESFTGTLVREITMKDEGDHHLTVTLSDGTKKEINLSSEYMWTNVPSNAVLGSKDADAITPSSSWKFATNLYAEGTVTSRGNALFNGVYNADMYSETWTMGGNYYTTFDENGNGIKTSGNTQLLAAPYDTIWFDFGEPLRMSGVRLHERSRNIVTAKVYGTNKIDGDATEWKLLGETKNNGTVTNTITFKKNYSYRYIKIKFAVTEQVYTFLNEVVILAPKTLLSSDANVTVDVSEGDLAQFKFDQGAADSQPSSLTTESGSNVKCSFDKGILTIDPDVIASLKDGSHKCIATFSTGETFTLTVTKKDSSKVSYNLYGSGTTGNLVLENPRDKEVKSLTFADGKAISKFTVSEDLKTITVARQLFRRVTDLFAPLDVEGTNVVTLTATYADDTTKEYNITIGANWSTATEVKGTYAADEIYPDITKWKARVSTAAGDTQAMGMLTKAAIKVKDAQNWHSFFGAVDGTVYGDSTAAIGHYIDIDFGENPAPYIGFRHLQRPAGSVWTAKNLVIMGKNAAGEGWTTIYNAVPTYKKVGEAVDKNGTWNILEADIRFEEEVTYRYVRLHVFSGEHATADTLHVLKKMASIEGAATVTVDKNVAESAVFKFDLSSAAAGVIAVKAGEAVVEAENYTFENGALTFKAEYIAKLSEGDTALTVTIDGWDNVIKITKLDKFTKTYTLVDAEVDMGDYELKLYTLNGDTVTGVTYDGKAVEHTIEGDRIVIARHVFRKLNDDFFLIGEATIKVTYENAGEVDYNIAIVSDELTVTDQDGEFASDEIEPAYGTWKVRVSSSNGAKQPGNFFAKKALTSNSYNWHTAYTVVNGSQVIFENTTSKHYAEVDFGSETKFSGIRYYARAKGDTSGDWSEVKLLGSNDDGATWTEIMPWTATGINANVREATLKIGENVSYKKVRIYIYSGWVASGTALAFLKPETVDLVVEGTTGGDIYVEDSDLPSGGTNQVDANKEVTYTAKADEGNEFMYWVEANTGRVLGREEALKLQTTVGKNIKAVFAESGADKPFVSFFGKDGRSVIATGNVDKTVALGKQDEAITIPSAEKLYATGYTFKHWIGAGKTYTAEEIAAATIEAATEFVAIYSKNETVKYTVTVENGSVKGNAEVTYNTKVTVKADEAPEGKVFNYWTIEGEIVSYAEEYSFFMPDHNVTVTAVFGETKVEEEITISMTKNTSTTTDANGDEVNVAGFIASRNIPENAKVLEVGIIYVKDKFDANGVAYSNENLTISAVGSKSQAKKDVKVAIAIKNGKDGDGNEVYASGQHKLSASYKTEGIAARGFITYLDGKTVKTVYTDTMTIG